MMEAIYASDLHSGLEQLWQKALNYRGPVIILADAKEQIRIENELIKRFASGAFQYTVYADKPLMDPDTVELIT